LRWNVEMSGNGLIVVLNGVPRSGKSSIVRSIQDTFEGVWVNLGVDLYMQHVIPPRLLPGIGLRPGGERPDLEEHLPVLFQALYASVIEHSRLGLNVVVDIGHHEGHSRPLGVLNVMAEQLQQFPAYFIGVRCPVQEIMARRDAGRVAGETRYVGSGPLGEIPDEVLRFERFVHDPAIYDLEVNTSVLSPKECAIAIRRRIAEGQPRAFAKLAELGTASR
jgi:chloramphenicol 3-O phosphotransferase